MCPFFTWIASLQYLNLDILKITVFSFFSYVQMLLAKHHNETINHYDEQSSEPESETAPAQVHSDSTSEDPVLTKPSESTGNGQGVQFLGEV